MARDVAAAAVERMVDEMLRYERVCFCSVRIVRIVIKRIGVGTAKDDRWPRGSCLLRMTQQCTVMRIGEVARALHQNSKKIRTTYRRSYNLGVEATYREKSIWGV